MEIVSSTVGWSTTTGWKRRSSAASFSMCLRYSSSVVAPIVWSSPRASIGLSRLRASMAPSAAPGAHDRVELVDEEDDPALAVLDLLEDRLQALLELAAVLGAGDHAPRGRAPTTRLSLSVSGTSPRTIRWASPSTMAVLPTPGSPMRTGLFFVRRERTWMTRRISSSRPMTGSSLPGPGLLGQVAAVLLERLVRALRASREVTRWPPRIRRGRRGAPRGRPRDAPGAPGPRRPTSTIAEQEVLGRDELVAQAARLLGRALQHAAAAGRGSAGRRRSSPGARGAPASSPRKAARSDAQPAERLGGDPLVASTSAARRCSASRTGLWSRSASACAPAIASWAFWVNRSRFMVVVGSGRGRVGWRWWTAQVPRGSGWSMASRNGAAARARLVEGWAGRPGP